MSRGAVASRSPSPARYTWIRRTLMLGPFAKFTPRTHPEFLVLRHLCGVCQFGQAVPETARRQQKRVSM